MSNTQEKKLLREIELRLSAKLNQDVYVISNSNVSGGCISNAGKLITTIGTYFLKWNSNCPSDLFLREAESLQELSKVKNPYLTIPEVIDVKELDDTPAFLILTYIEQGDSYSNCSDEELGKGLALVHKHSSDKFGFYAHNYCGASKQNNTWSDNWVDFFGNNRLNHIIKLSNQVRSIPTEHMKIYERLLMKLPDLIPNNSSPSLIHGDLWSGNYMYTNNKPALIDPATYYADREMEMGIMTMFGGFSNRFWDSYHEVYPLPHDWKERNLLYQLYHVLNHYYLFGGAYGQQAFQIAKYYAA